MWKKIFSILFILAIIGASFWAYKIYLKRGGKPMMGTKQENIQLKSDSGSDIVSTDDLTSNKDADNNSAVASDNQNVSSENPVSPAADPSTSSADKSAPKVSVTPKISGATVAHITPEHCNNDCQAFAIDLKLFEYCQESCGISPIKNVSSCDNQKDIQKDYCLKDLAINKKDVSGCDKISDANIIQACKSRIAQDAIENLQ